MNIQNLGAACPSGIDPNRVAHGRDRDRDRVGRFANAIAAAGNAIGLDAEVASLQQDIAKAIDGAGIAAAPCVDPAARVSPATEAPVSATGSALLDRLV